MRRTHQRQLGARRVACLGAEPRNQREYVAELVWAHLESIALVRRLLWGHERAERSQAEADCAAGVAAANPFDRRANERELEAAALAAAAHLADLQATDAWTSHVMRLQGLMAMAEELYWNRACAPGHTEQTAAAATALTRFRSRDDCLDRHGWPPREAFG